MKKGNIAIIVVLAVFTGALLISVSFRASAFSGKESDCATCHAHPATSLWLKVDKASVEVSPGESFELTIKGGGGTTGGTVIKIPSKVKDNGLFSIEKNMISETTGNLTLTTTITAPSIAGTYTLRVYITSGSGTNSEGVSIAKETAYEDVSVTVVGGELDITAWGVQVTLGTLLIGVITVFAVKMATRKAEAS